MANHIPINPQLLIWARTTAGYSVEDLSANKHFAKIKLWESGTESPTYAQLEKLAEKFHRPLAVFFFPKPPLEEPIEKALRAISEDFLSNLSPTIRFLFRKAKAFQLSLAELFHGQQESQQQRLSWLTEAHAKESSSFAEKIRATLGISIEDQQSWQSSDQALKEWRRALAQKGVFVFKDSFKNSNVAGFCVYDNLFPVIFINNSHPKNRQIFTLFHELCHLLLKHSFLDSSPEEFWQDSRSRFNSEEALCNRLASEILVPTEHFLSQVSQQPMDEPQINHLSHAYHVSREVIARKLIDYNLIRQEFYQSMIDHWQATAKQHVEESEKGGGSYYNTKAAYLGDAYISVVLKSYYQGRIDMLQAADYLDIKPKSFASLEEKFLERSKADVYL